MNITLIYFEGCPHAENSKALLKKLEVDFEAVDQNKLDANDRLLGYSSPSILIKGDLIYGSKIHGSKGGCSIEPLSIEKLESLIRIRMG